jgi:hypothetical protein
MDDLNQIICDYPNNNCLNSYNCLNFRLDCENRIVVTGVAFHFGGRLMIIEIKSVLVLINKYFQN